MFILAAATVGGIVANDTFIALIFCMKICRFKIMSFTLHYLLSEVTKLLFFRIELHIS